MIRMTGDADENIKANFEDVIRELAMQRVMILKLNVMSEEEVTKMMNEKGEEYTKKYEAMHPLEIMLDRVGDMIEEVKKNGE